MTSKSIFVDYKKKLAQERVLAERLASCTPAPKKPYTASKWCREMTNQAKRDTDSKGVYKPSTRFVEELRKVGALNKKKPPKEAMDEYNIKH